MGLELLRFVRSIDDTPIIDASHEDIYEWYMHDSHFVTADHYPRGVDFAPGEMGLHAIMRGLDIYPVVRIRGAG